MVVQRPSISHQGLIALLTALMTYVLTSSLSAFWKMTLPSLSLILFSAGVALFAWLCWRYPWATLFLTSASVIGAVVASRYYPDSFAWTGLVLTEWLEFWSKIRLLQIDTTFGPRIGLVFVGTIGFFMGLLALLEALTEGRAFWSLTAGAVIFATEWLWYFDRSLSSFMIYCMLGFSLWALGQAAQRDAYWVLTGRRVGYRSNLVIPVVTVVITAVVAATLPSNFGPIDLGRLGDELQNRFPVLQQMRGGAGPGLGRFSLRYTGFSPTVGTLGGPVTPSNEVALKLTTEKPLSGTAYLRGATFNTYTGSTWRNEETQYIQIPPEGDIPTSFGVDVLREYLSFKVTPAVNLGFSVFSMLEPMRVEELKSEFQVDSDGNIWANRAPAKGSTYSIMSRLPRYSSEQVRLLSTAPVDGMKQYLQVPATMPRRVGEAARSIAGGQEHPYDKAVAIEAFLRGFVYSLDVPSTPTGRDFVDYFLFDLQEGYCMYSATAMSVLLRELGIPTRFVEGFAIPASSEPTRNPDGTYSYEIRNSQSHAWVEAYFPGYGWMTFDPTPRSDLPIIDRSTPAPAASGSFSGSDGSDDLNPEDTLGADDLGLDPFNEQGGLLPASGGAAREEWPWAAAVLGALALLIVAGYRRLQSQDRIRATEAPEVVQEAWDKSERLLDRFSEGRHPGQTPMEYARRLGREWPTLKEPAEKVATDYTNARYAPTGTEVPPEATTRARQLWALVHEQLLARFGWRLYLLRRLAGRRRFRFRRKDRSDSERPVA